MMEVRGYIQLYVPNDIYTYCKKNNINLKSLDPIDKLSKTGEIHFVIHYLDNKKNGEQTKKKTDIIIGSGIQVPIILDAVTKKDLVEASFKKILLPEIDKKTEKQKFYYRLISVMNYSSNKKKYDECMEFKQMQDF